MALAIPDSATAPRPTRAGTGRAPCRHPSRHRRGTHDAPRRRGRHRYARRRATAAVVLMVAGVAAFSATSAVASAVGSAFVGSPTASTPSADRSVVLRTVRPGDTLWGLAADLGGPGDIRARVDQLARLNGGPALEAGAIVRIPRDWLEPQP